MAKTKRRKLSAPPKAEGSCHPFDNLPENHLFMRVKSGTKIRNVLAYALEQFPKRSCVVWTGFGDGIGKAITCAELFKRNQPQMHQLTKLRYTRLTTSDSKRSSRAPEIHILLTKSKEHVGEIGYQGPEDSGYFLDEVQVASDSSASKDSAKQSDEVSGSAADEFAAMGLRTGKKRQRRNQKAELPAKKNKRSEKEAS